MSGTTCVFIRNLELLSHIGVHGHEQGMPQPVRINVELWTVSAGANDHLDGVVDYETVANGIHTLVAAGHVNLAETLADRIVQLCMSDERVLRARVRVEKLHALHGAESAGVEIERVRGS